MRKDEVIRFLQLVMYYEVLPLDADKTDYSTIVKYCARTAFVNSTPDGNCIISAKGWDLLNGKIQWDEQLPLLSTYPPITDNTMKATYLLAGAVAG